MSRALKEARRIRRLYERKGVFALVTPKLAFALAAEYAFGDRETAYAEGRAIAIWR